MAIGGVPYEVDICPGWLVRQPGVAEGAEAFFAVQSNALEVFDPVGLNVIWEMVVIAKSAFNAYEKYRLERLKNR